MAKRFNNSGNEIICDRVIELKKGGRATFPTLREGVQSNGVKNLSIRITGDKEITAGGNTALHAKIFYVSTNKEATIFNNNAYYKWYLEGGDWSATGQDIAVPSSVISPATNKGVITCTMSNGEFSVSTSVSVSFKFIKQYTWSNYTEFSDFKQEPHVWEDEIKESTLAYLWSRESKDGGVHYEYFRVTGAGGLQSFRPVLYKKQTTPPENYKGQQLFYTFSTGALTTAEGAKEPFDGWTSSIPDSEGDVYAIYSFAKGRDDTVKVADWTPAVKLSTEGTEGLAGFSQADVNLYARQKEAPAKPNYTITYRFADGTLSGVKAPWQKNIPDFTAIDDVIWVTSSVAISRGETDTLDGWTEPVIFARNGLQGEKGDKGDKGEDGTQGMYIDADKSTVTFPANSAGIVSNDSFDNFVCNVYVKEGSIAYTPVSSDAVLEKGQFKIEITETSPYITGLLVDSNAIVFGTGASFQALQMSAYANYKVTYKTNNGHENSVAKTLSFNKSTSGPFIMYQYLLQSIKDPAPTNDTIGWTETYQSPNEEQLSWSRQYEVIPPSDTSNIPNDAWKNIRPTSASYEWMVQKDNQISQIQQTSDTIVLKVTDEKGTVGCGNTTVAGMTISVTPDGGKLTLEGDTVEINRGVKIQDDTLFTSKQKINDGGVLYGGDAFTLDSAGNVIESTNPDAKGFMVTADGKMFMQDATISSKSTLKGNVNNKYLKIYNENANGTDVYTAELGAKTGWRFEDLRATSIFNTGVHKASPSSVFGSNPIAYTIKIPSSQIGGVSDIGYISAGTNKIFDGKFRVRYSSKLYNYSFLAWQREGEHSIPSDHCPPRQQLPSEYPSSEDEKAVICEGCRQIGGGGGGGHMPRFEVIYGHWGAHWIHPSVYVNSSYLGRDSYIDVSANKSEIYISISGKAPDFTVDDFPIELINSSFSPDVSYLVGYQYKYLISDMTEVHTDHLLVDSADSDNYRNFSNIVITRMNGAEVRTGFFQTFNTTPVLKYVDNISDIQKQFLINDYISISTDAIIYDGYSTKDSWYSSIDLQFEPVAHRAGIEADTIIPMNENTSLGAEEKPYADIHSTEIHSKLIGNSEGTHTGPVSIGGGWSDIGYALLPNGMMMQWGFRNDTGDNLDEDYVGFSPHFRTGTIPKVFITGIYNKSGGVGDHKYMNTVMVVRDSVSNTGFTWLNDSGWTFGVNWIAIGQA